MGVPCGAGMGRRAAVPVLGAHAGSGSGGSSDGRPEEPPARPGDDSEVDEVMRRGGGTRPAGHAVTPVPLGAAVRRCSRIPPAKGPCALVLTLLRTRSVAPRGDHGATRTPASSAEERCRSRAGGAGAAM